MAWTYAWTLVYAIIMDHEMSFKAYCTILFQPRQVYLSIKSCAYTQIRDFIIECVRHPPRALTTELAI